jgi:Domain of unknown function (DUF4287)
MTAHKSFKRLVRQRMEKTGESYTAARAQLLSAEDRPVLTMSEEAIQRRTGHGWEHWFDLVDDWGGADKPHKEIATWLREELGVAGWDAQSITVSYERARLGRALGEKADGFSITASKTVAVPVERLYDAFLERAPGELRERTATRPKSARFDWGDGGTRVVVGFEPKGDAKSLVALEHERLPDADEAERMKAYWRERVTALKKELES